MMNANVGHGTCPSYLARALLALLLGAGGCDATPLPMPPAFDASRLSLVDKADGYVRMGGEPLAVVPGDQRLRVTGPDDVAEVRVAEDGSFEAVLRGRRDQTFYLEALLSDEDRFLAAVTGASGTTRAVSTTPGPDRDVDGSPDAVDCAPDDPALSGSRCGCVPEPERCDGRDNNCDGQIDEMVCACSCPTQDLGSSTGPVLASGSSVGGCMERSGGCGGGAGPEVTFVWTAPTDGTFTFDTVGSTFDTVLYVFSGACAGSELACSDDEGGQSTSAVTLSLSLGQQITLVVDAFSSGGDFVLNVSL